MTTHPALDVVTERALVAHQDRPVVPFSSWVADAVSANAETERGLQVVTPADARITFPLRTILTRPGGRWVVEEPDRTGHYDGLTGAPLVWDQTAGYVVDPDTSGTRSNQNPNAPTRSATFLREQGALGAHLLFDLTAVSPASDSLVLGGAAETLVRTFARSAPAGWGTSEPALAPWDRPSLTATCRRRAPKSSWLTFVGPGGDIRPFLGTQRVSRTPSGVRESVTAAVSYAEDEQPALQRIEDAVEQLAEQGLLHVLTVYRMPGRFDLTYAPHAPSVPVPVALALSSEAAAEWGQGHVTAAPVSGHRIGPQASPSVLFSLGDGTTPDGWERFTALIRHLRPAREDT